MKDTAVQTAATIRELFTLLLESGRWWLIPMTGILFLVAVLLLILTAAEYFAPFVYSVF